MKERPILFSGPMIRAILAGEKTQTRRAMKPQPFMGTPEIEGSQWLIYDGDKPVVEGKLRFMEGDRLWVRETWCPANSDNGPVVLYKANCDRRYLVDKSYPVDYDLFPAGKGAWSAWAGDVESGSTKAYRPAIHMPRWASRLTLRVTDVRIQRLRDLSEEDAKAEGVERMKSGRGYYSIKHGHAAVHFGVYHDYAKEAFAELWESINGDGSWDANPWVYAISFEVEKAPDDYAQLKSAKHDEWDLLAETRA